MSNTTDSCPELENVPRRNHLYFLQNYPKISYIREGLLNLHSLSYEECCDLKDELIDCRHSYYRYLRLFYQSFFRPFEEEINIVDARIIELSKNQD